MRTILPPSAKEIVLVIITGKAVVDMIDMTCPEISVVIPTFNRLDRIKRVIEALAQQRYPRDAFEIVVVSDGSTDGTN